MAFAVLIPVGLTVCGWFAIPSSGLLFKKMELLQSGQIAVLDLLMSLGNEAQFLCGPSVGPFWLA